MPQKNMWTIPKELKRFQLKKFDFFENQVALQIPDFMEYLPQEEIQRRFIGMEHPEAVLSSPNYDAFISFARFSKE